MENEYDLERELDRYNFHGLFRCRISQLERVTYSRLVKQPYTFSRTPLPRQGPGFIWVRRSTVYIASPVYATPPSQRLELEENKFLASLHFAPGYWEKNSCGQVTTEDGVRELRAGAGTFRPSYTP